VIKTKYSVNEASMLGSQHTLEPLNSEFLRTVFLKGQGSVLVKLVLECVGIIKAQGSYKSLY
jgi:hypothetical protein